ncbi:MAG TPA: LuxR C-terminal-related transcriptional regulator, partial [Candidatus Limnocylindrales bacterium]|nr:LuxR C-terminal-related transcriptional regulator [Candidatus Limnocylindrales bacterium]
MTARPLLETKFHPPIAHGRQVPRTRLSEQIGRAASATLTLVSAPAGFGKTTVMAELAHRPGAGRVTWLSLEPSDNDPVSFWTYVIEALERAVPGVGGAAIGDLAAGRGAVDVATTLLLNGLAAIETDVILVLDDLHVIESPEIHQQLGYFVEHLPARVHVVIGTRADPAIPLARLRARGSLVEIRASDLKFSAAEGARYLENMGLALRADDVAALERRTEGWIAALQLAALSLQGRPDATEFITAFAGDDRHIVDYLVEEVLRRQPPRIRDFLLNTSILSRFTAPLADAVMAADDGAATIELLDRGNLFVVALDSQRRWYRYHHLFGGVLQAHLAAEQPAQVAILHRRASDWFEEAGDRPAAVEHAFHAGDPARTAELVELAIPELRQYRREATIRRWVDAIPRDVVASRPVLMVSYAGAILSANLTDRVDELLTGAEQRMTSGEPPVVVDHAELRRLPAMIELYRAALSKLHGDLEGNIAHARRVLELVDEDDDIGRGGAETFLGLAAWGMGDLEEGYAWYARGLASLERGGLLTDVVGARMIGADIRMAAGRLTDAMRIYEDGLARATRTQPPLRGVTDMHTGLADVAYQRGRLDEAQAHLDAGRHLGDELGFPREPYRWRLVRARILQARGDLEAALALLEEAERLYLSEFSPDIHPVPAIRARVLIAHGRLAEARAWAVRARVTPADALSYVREYEHVTLARLLVGEGTDRGSRALPASLELLDRLLAAAEAGRRDGSRLEILVVRALALHAAGDADGAVATLDEAIGIAEPEGYVRVFLDEGPAMTQLLQAAARRSGAKEYVQHLLRGSSRPEPVPPASQGLVEPLSERELEVLRLLRSELDGPGIARELVVSLNTLRTHTKNIYAKLGVGSRRGAVRRAEELDLI